MSRIYRQHQLKSNLCEKAGTIGYVMTQHRDEILAVKSSSEACTLLTKLFEEAKINTPKSRQILFKLQNGMSYSSTLLYLNNIIMSASQLAVIC